MTGRRAVAGTLLVAAFAWYLGASVWHAILAAAVLATGAWVLDALDTSGEGADTSWPLPERSTRIGARTELSELARSLRGHRGVVGEHAAGDVRAIARRRLAARALDLDDPGQRAAIEPIVGRRAYAMLTASRWAPATRRALEQCLDALDGLDAPDERSAPARTR